MDPGTYILSAAIATAEQAECARAAVAELLLPGQVKLHWRDERPSRKQRIAQTISRLEIDHLVVVTSPHAPDARPERRRRLTLDRLLPDLEGLGVGQTTIESRGEADDRRDRVMLDNLRSRRLIGPSLRIQHQRGRSEPLLWVPDALCGIVTELRCGNSSMWEMIRHKVTLKNFEP